MSLKISVIIVTCNRAKKLKLAIKSLLNGSKIPEEILIIDNNSSDNTRFTINKIIKQYPNINIKYYFEPRKGIPFARNKGLDNAKYDIIAFIDDDCIVHKDWIKNIIQTHENYPNYSAIGGLTLNYKTGIVSNMFDAFRLFWTYEASIDKIKYLDVFNKEFQVVSLGTQNISYKKKVINGLRFNRKLINAGDVDFSWQILKKYGNILYHHEIIVYHNYSNRLNDLIKKFFQYGKYVFFLNENAIKNNYYPKKIKKLKEIISIPLIVHKYIQENKIISFIIILFIHIVFCFGYLYASFSIVTKHSLIK